MQGIVLKGSSTFLKLKVTLRGERVMLRMAIRVKILFPLCYKIIAQNKKLKSILFQVIES